MLLMMLALAADPDFTAADRQLARMTGLYEQLCLKTFPDDKAVEAIMKDAKARELTEEEVKVTMGKDPARGWQLADGSASVWLEFPPYHACTVRWNAPRIGDLKAYRAIADAYERAAGGFRPIKPMDGDLGPLHVHAVGEDRVLPNKVRETLFVIDQHIKDPARRAAGETGVVLRFVHQLAAPLPAER